MNKEARAVSAEAEERQAPGGNVVHHAVEREGEAELARSNSALAWSGLAAGLSMGFSMVAQALFERYLPATPWRPLVASLGYPMGFLIVVLGRQQLFTENTLTVILPLLRRRDRGTLLNVLRLWGIVLAANLLGALLFATVAAHLRVFDAELLPYFAELGRRAMEPDAGVILVRGIFGGWLIATMVWLLPFAETARVWVIVILTYLVGLGGFTHVIAGSIEALFLVVTGKATIGAYLAGFLLPALVGNVIGGVSLVAALAHAQYVATVEDKKSPSRR